MHFLEIEIQSSFHLINLMRCQELLPFADLAGAAGVVGMPLGLGIQ
jgi:hypothetical protein